MESLLRGLTSQVERGIEAVTLITCILEAARPYETGGVHILGQCMVTVLAAVSQGAAPTPTTLANLLACLGISRYAAFLIAHPTEQSGLGGQEEEADANAGMTNSESKQEHIANLLGLAAACFSKAGGHVAGGDILDALLSPADLQTSKNLPPRLQTPSAMYQDLQVQRFIPCLED